MAVVAVGGQQYSQGSVNSGTPSQEKSGMASARKRSQCDPAGISQTIFLFFIIIGYWMKKGTENGLGKQKIGAALNDIGLLGASIISGFVLPKLLRKLNVTGGRCGSCDSLIQQTIQGIIPSFFVHANLYGSTVYVSCDFCSLFWLFYC
jgi:hypothetical protein